MKNGQHLGSIYFQSLHMFLLAYLYNDPILILTDCMQKHIHDKLKLIIMSTICYYNKASHTFRFRFFIQYRQLLCFAARDGILSGFSSRYHRSSQGSLVRGRNLGHMCGLLSWPFLSSLTKSNSSRYQGGQYSANRFRMYQISGFRVSQYCQSSQ